MRDTPGWVSYRCSMCNMDQANGPSALLLRWMAHIRISLDDVCETSPRMWNALNFMLRCHATATQNGPSGRQREGLDHETCALDAADHGTGGVKGKDGQGDWQRQR